MAMVWKDKREVDLTTNIHSPPAEGKFCDEKGNAIMPHIVEDYNCHMGYVDKGDRMANSYIFSCHTWRLSKKLFLHLLDLAILNSYNLLSSTSRVLMKFGIREIVNEVLNNDVIGQCSSGDNNESDDDCTQLVTSSLHAATQ